MVVAKNDEAHRRLAKQFSAREVHKTYLALVHGWPKKDRGTIQTAISRHSQRRNSHDDTRRGRTRRGDALRRDAKGRLSLWQICFARSEDRNRADAPDSRTHGIAGASGGGRCTLWSAGRAEVAIEQGAEGRHAGDAGAIPKFLHSAELELTHPKTEQEMKFRRPLPPELESLLASLESASGR